MKDLTDMKDLTEEEKKMILELREKKALRSVARLATLNILRVSLLFETWKQETGGGKTYSTFCDDFGYVAGEGENREATYKIVMKIINFAHMSR